VERLATVQQCLREIGAATAALAVPILESIRREAAGTAELRRASLEVDALLSQLGAPRGTKLTRKQMQAELDELVGKELGGFAANDAAVRRIRKLAKDNGFRILYKGQPVHIRAVHGGTVQCRLYDPAKTQVYANVAWPRLTAAPPLRKGGS
jgi:hypothetical protein